MPYVQTIDQREERPEIRLPDCRIVSHGQTLRGVVVDPQGKPVPGITVSANIAGGDTLARPPDLPKPWTDTDELGRFELRQLPDQPIELMAYRPNKAGGRIRYPSKVRPRMNQTDIRIILDPKLLQDVEDLDAK